MRQVTHALLTRPPLTFGASSSGPFDLHVLSTPPAFILSQDQTLCKSLFFSRQPFGYLSFLLFGSLNRSLNVKNFRESYVFHCSVIKVVAALATAHSAYHFVFVLSRTFFKFFQNLFWSVAVSLTTLTSYHVFSLLSTFIFNFLKTFWIVCLFNTIHPTAILIYHSVRQMSTKHFDYFLQFIHRYIIHFYHIQKNISN